MELAGNSFEVIVSYKIWLGEKQSPWQHEKRHYRPRIADNGYYEILFAVDFAF